MNMSNHNEGISIIADFKDRAISFLTTPLASATSTETTRSRNAGVHPIAEFTDKAQASNEADANTLANSDDAQRLLEGMAQLSPIERRVAVSYFFEQRNQHEIAAELGIADSVTQGMLTRVLARIRASLVRT
jgi:DNA-directed RNA polymerase specialized sigma subunit